MSVELAVREAPAAERIVYSRRPRRSDALERVAQNAGALCDALATSTEPLSAEVQLALGGMQYALFELAQSRGKTPGINGRRVAGPATEKDARGYDRAPSTQPGYNKGRVPANKGQKYPPDPPTAAEVFALLQACAPDPFGHRLKALIVILWRSGLRISEALALEERDLDGRAGSIIVRHGKGDKRRIIGMDPWGWEILEAWIAERENYPRGPVFCVLTGPTAGRRWTDVDVRRQLHKLADQAGIRKRIAPHQFRHALAVDLVREGSRVDLLQKQLGHSNLGVTSTYLASVSAAEVVELAHGRRPPATSVPDLLAVLR